MSYGSLRPTYLQPLVGRPPTWKGHTMNEKAQAVPRRLDITQLFGCSLVVAYAVLAFFAAWARL
jgi:hypothetical protein